MVRAKKWDVGVKNAQSIAFALAAATLKARCGLDDLQRRLDALNEAISEAEGSGGGICVKSVAASGIEDGERTNR